MAHVFWVISAMEYKYGVAYAVPDRFQQVTVKVRSQSGQKGSNFEVDTFQQKVSLWCSLASGIRWCHMVLCGTFTTAVKRIQICITVYVGLYCMLYIRNLYIFLSSMIQSFHAICDVIYTLCVSMLLLHVAHNIQFFFRNEF